ncbi:MAG: hypothetical protein H7Z19_17360 [Chitinophagaceae bacterium]|nr:hypothetical protein [Rubrivivax sp.]
MHISRPQPQRHRRAPVRQASLLPSVPIQPPSEAVTAFAASVSSLPPASVSEESDQEWQDFLSLGMPVDVPDAPEGRGKMILLTY